MKIPMLILPMLLISIPSYASVKKYELNQDFAPVVNNERIDLWIPVPTALANYQKVISRKHTGNADSVVTEKVGSVEMLHAIWRKPVKPELHVTEILEIQDHRSPTLTHADVRPYLKPTAHVQTDGIVRETAEKIVSSLTDDDQKAQAIYQWIVEKTLRDPNTRGCGLGDVKTTLQAGNLSGKCADLNSLFVGLSRAAGVPAREVFGVRVDASTEAATLGRSGDVTKAQHCRAEYYSKNQKAWVPVDPADVRKAILEEKLALDDPKIVHLREKFFGYWEGNWAFFNEGRDFKIRSGKNEINVNYLMYPMMRSASSAPDGMDPKEVSYTLTSRVLVLADKEVFNANK